MVANRKIISLFSGAMGLDLGLEHAGFQTAVAVEINRAAVQTLRLNRPTLSVFEKSVSLVSSAEILAESKMKLGEPCLVTGGPCCQSFSTAGKRKSVADARGSLFFDFKRIVAETRPRFFVMENVKGILSAAVQHRPLNERGPGHPPLSCDEHLGTALSLILKELEELRYHIVFGLVNAADYGVPQKRWRVIFIGSRDGETIRIPDPTHDENGAHGLLPWVTLRKAIGSHREKEPGFIAFSRDRFDLLALLKAGQNWRDLPEHLHATALGAAYDSWGGRVGFCRRLDWNAPAPTLTTSPNGRATTLCHPRDVRPLTVREYAILQQFPKHWKFFGSTQQQYMQIGNAVPIGLGNAIGEMLRKTMDRTTRFGLPKDARSRLGKTVCDEKLQERIETRPKTQLNPARMLENSDPKEIKKWLQETAIQGIPKNRLHKPY
ncbi:MAG: DNA cytosine methyltransferase [Kiritimatiellales bacterium]|jgi:DNA (cytosine-5)-methyltransferase 1